MANWPRFHLASRSGFKSPLAFLASKEIEISKGVERQMREAETEKKRKRFGG